jgi:hypothetical protein
MGHSSYITHLDWSADSRILQSNCGAYELLYFEGATGKQVGHDPTQACCRLACTCCYRTISMVHVALHVALPVRGHNRVLAWPCANA